jgi:Protein of unknown function (DUF1572)
MSDDLARAVGVEASEELNRAHERIRHCLAQLSDEQIWSRPRPEMNSIGNLILHLCGNVRQWVVSGLGGAADIRNRPAEFAERGPIPRADLERQLGEVVAEARKVLAGVSGTEWLRVRRIQGHDVSGLSALFNTVPHFRGHTQEIIHQTRALLGDRYRMAWAPATKEQGAPA